MKLLILMFSIWLFLASSCTNGEVSPDSVVAPPTTTPIPLPGSVAREQLRNDVVNEAIRFANVGCPGLSERLSGHPTRIIAALTNSAVAGGLAGAEADFELGPGGAGAANVWVVAVEGSSIPVIGEDPWGGANIRSFVFVIRAGESELTGCILRDAPMPLAYRSYYGGFDFEVLIDRR